MVLSLLGSYFVPWFLLSPYEGVQTACCLLDNYSGTLIGLANGIFRQKSVSGYWGLSCRNGDGLSGSWA